MSTIIPNNNKGNNIYKREEIKCRIIALFVYLTPDRARWMYRKIRKSGYF